MVSDKNITNNKKRWIGMGCSPGPGAVYGLGFLGALVYFIQHAPNFWEGVLGILKALIWPAILVYKALELLKM